MGCPATDVAVADVATKGATDAGVAGAADAAGTGAIAADAAGTGAVAADAAGTGALAADAAGAGAAGAGAAGTAGALPEVTVTAPAIAGGADGADAGLGAIAPAAMSAGLASTGGGAPGGSPATGAPGATTADFLPATSETSIGSLSPEQANAFGISNISGGDTSIAGPDIGGGVNTPDLGAGSADSGSNDVLNWFKNPKNAATLGLLGISGVNALRQPKLPTAATTALNAAGPAVQNAESIIQSGGTATPIWRTQKASIDSSIDKGMSDAIAAYQQTAANAGMEGGVVQQQISQIKAEWEKNRQQAYLQAQQQNVSNAVAELTGSDQVLAQIAQMQLSQSQEARQIASQTAELALLLGTGTSLPAGTHV